METSFSNEAMQTIFNFSLYTHKPYNQYENQYIYREAIHFWRIQQFIVAKDYNNVIL